MIKQLKEQNKLGESFFLAVASIFCFMLSVFRMYYTSSKLFLFLNWNLFLAFLPWLFSTLLLVYPKWRKNKLLILILMPVWLLFFPNAPYILTDLFHLKVNSVMPTWFDLLLILSFAWVGLLYGFISLWNIERVLKENLNKHFVTFLSTVLLFIGSFGIYLGRFLRWNSWDILQQPIELIYDISDRITNPFQHPATWGMTILMGLFLNLIYWSFKLLSLKTQDKSKK